MAHVLVAGALNGIEALRLWDIEGPQDQPIHHAEHDCVRADGHGQRQDGCDGEAGRFAQLAQCVAKILEPGDHNRALPAVYMAIDVPLVQPA